MIEISNSVLQNGPIIDLKNLQPSLRSPKGSAWATGGQYQKQKKFKWDIFGLFGYKNVIKTRPQRPGPPYRPPRPTRFI